MVFIPFPSGTPSTSNYFPIIVDSTLFEFSKSTFLSSGLIRLAAVVYSITKPSLIALSQLFLPLYTVTIFLCTCLWVPVKSQYGMGQDLGLQEKNCRGCVFP